MDDKGNPPPPAGPFDAEAWASWMKDVMGRQAAAAWKRPDVEHFVSMVAHQALETFDASHPTHRLAKVLPRDARTLHDFVLDRSHDLERRGRALGVMILRGAHLEWPYHVMVKLLQGPLLREEPLRLDTEEKLFYQRETVDAFVKSEPGLFHRLSESVERLPAAASGHCPATEWMRTHLREGGLLGRELERERLFMPWLERLPALIRGRAMFHLAEAAGAQDLGRVTTHLRYVGASATAATFRLTWAIADSHWRRVADHVLGRVERSLGYDYGTGVDPAKAADRVDFHRGYAFAAGH